MEAGVSWDVKMSYGDGRIEGRGMIHYAPLDRTKVRCQLWTCGRGEFCYNTQHEEDDYRQHD